MTERKEKVLHSYDGIQEFDNPLPGWWKGLFLLCVVWAVFYTVAITLDFLPTYGVDLQRGQKELEDIRNAYKQSRPLIKVTPELLASAVADEAKVLQGAAVFSSNCASCHADRGQGLIGPNLIDAYWIHGGSMISIYQTVLHGVPAKGMPPWNNILLPEEMVQVTAYIDTLRGTKAPAAKAPEGELYRP